MTGITDQVVVTKLACVPPFLGRGFGGSVRRMVGRSDVFSPQHSKEEPVSGDCKCSTNSINKTFPTAIYHEPEAFGHFGFLTKSRHC